MNKPEVNINCPKCGKKIDVDEILYRQLESDIKQNYNTQIADVKKEYEDKEGKLKERLSTIEEKEKNINEKISNEVKSKLAKQKSELRAKITKDIEEENTEYIKSIQTELAEKSNKLKDFGKAKADIERLKREKSELREEIELENQKKISETLITEREKIAKSEKEKSELKISEKEEVIEQLKKQLTIAQQKAEQGSMQLQGEVQELAIEEWLRNNFPMDDISEVKKGARGADCLQTIKTYASQNCGTIYYESKRTKDFQPSWIEKFKNDIRDKGANIGVLVTDAMPKGLERLGLVNGVWVCSYNEFKGLCFVLRENIIAISNAVSSQENKGEKMVMLYNFLTGNEFKLQIESIVEGFTQMQTDLNSEKRSIQGHWKKREKQIQKVLLNTNFMYNSFKGIAGNAIEPIKALELAEPEVEIET